MLSHPMSSLSSHFHAQSFPNATTMPDRHQFSSIHSSTISSVPLATEMPVHGFAHHSALDRHHPHQQQQHHHHHHHHHHEQEFPVPMQYSSHRQQQEPSEEFRRPSSTEPASDPVLPTFQPAMIPLQDQQQRQPSLQSQYVSYDNGPSVLPMPMIHQPPYRHSIAYNSTPGPFHIIHKKRYTRVSQACDQCRQLKAKCDGTSPCRTCKDKGIECQYKEPIPKAIDKVQADILECIQSLNGLLPIMCKQVDGIEERTSRLETIVVAIAATARSGGISMKQLSSHERESRPSPRSSAQAKKRIRRYYPDEAIREEEAMVSIESTPLSTTAADKDKDKAEPGLLSPSSESALLAPDVIENPRSLLDWPSIRELTRHHLERENVNCTSEFPIAIEQNRGPLKVYGRGEDSKRRLLMDAPGHGSMDLVGDLSDGMSSSLSSPASDWGQLGGLDPEAQVVYQGGVLGFDGSPDFTEFRIWSYVESFRANILIMHPLIQPRVLDEWVHHFLDGLTTATPKSARQPMAPKPTFAVSSTPKANSSKRKRSPGPEGPDGPQTLPRMKTGRLSRCIRSALILIIIALGKICLHRESVPDVVSQGGQPAGYGLKKNYEAIPGLEYFALATDILGNHTGSYNNLESVYANVFAGIYQGQLARPLESFAFIHQASHKLQVIMQPSLDRLHEMKLNCELISDPLSNEIALAYWTCAQLESDLIAELPLPSSGILRYKDVIPYPNVSTLQGFDQRVLDSYLGQLYLQTHLNNIYDMCHSPHHSNEVDSDKLENVRLATAAVSGMLWVPHSFVFKENDLPATDTLSARLRAKYWHVQVITYRPFVRQILQRSWETKKTKHHPSGVMLADPSIVTPLPPSSTSSASSGDPDSSLLVSARKGINALVESTRAFYGLGNERPIITDIFGTAHAQWGNLLVLSAAFKDPILCQYIEEGLLKHLFEHTIHFLGRCATSTSSLKVGQRILEGLYRDLFPIVNFGISSVPLTRQP